MSNKGIQSIRNKDQRDRHPLLWKYHMEFLAIVNSKEVGFPLDQLYYWPNIFDGTFKVILNNVILY